jgi:hypothetical protein
MELIRAINYDLEAIFKIFRATNKYFIMGQAMTCFNHASYNVRGRPIG